MRRHTSTPTTGLSGTWHRKGRHMVLSCSGMPRAQFAAILWAAHTVVLRGSLKRLATEIISRRAWPVDTLASRLEAGKRHRSRCEREQHHLHSSHHVPSQAQSGAPRPAISNNELIRIHTSSDLSYVLSSSKVQLYIILVRAKDVSFKMLREEHSPICMPYCHCQG